jgi:hypothetical protein
MVSLTLVASNFLWGAPAFFAQTEPSYFFGIHR